MALRDKERLQDTVKRVNQNPLGSGALAGSTFPLDRESTSSLLNMATTSRNSLDSVSDRDFVVECLSALSLIMTHLSRLSEEIILWNTGNFGWIELDGSLCTGISMMPQKRNPDGAELIRGKTGRVYGNLMSLLTTLKALPLAYNKDMQEDKEPLFDSVETVKTSLYVMTAMIKTLKVRPEKMRQAAGLGFTNATDVADYLVRKGLPFREAHEVVGKLVLHGLKIAQPIEAMSLDVLRSFSDRIQPDIYDTISLEACIESRSIRGGPSPEVVKLAINEVKVLLRE
jgi:argininosuccinate lyase